MRDYAAEIMRLIEEAQTEELLALAVSLAALYTAAAGRLNASLGLRTGARAKARAERWLKASEAAERLGISVSTLYERAAAGVYPFVRRGPGRELRFSESGLERFQGGGKNGA